MSNNMGGGYYRAATVPPPRPWCKAVAESADVRALMRVDVKQQFSAAGKKLIVEGLEEAVERCAADGSFGWLHIMPLVDQLIGTPTVPLQHFSSPAMSRRSVTIRLHGFTIVL